MKTEKLKFALVISSITLSLLCILLILYPYMPVLNRLVRFPDTAAQVNKDIPIPFDNPQVSGVFVSYTFTGKITSLNSQKDITQLYLSGNSLLPLVVITSTTAVLMTKDPEPPVPASKDLLKEGQTVSVAAYYDVKNRSWTTTHVYIIPETHGPADVILPQ